ncbi:exodeoxyribonuclease V subunit alpha [Oceanisphaera avium]|uniref:RecBCD enzyme subunit RecD n=1 Tax=Oceanisphaera avium TaxID=1903694 RepID=A0A1Y0CV64_9GAMM|nr:exodeoxyribonuclease V subunit alpha [Oceanisphaera avium]ART79221.1 exodeoxyribonuclease V subunit alpha [Oceanisphaera avium]
MNSLEAPVADDALDVAALQHSAALFRVLGYWQEKGWLRALDVALAHFFYELEPSSSPLLLLASALTSHQLGHGHVCLDLNATLTNADFVLALPPEGEAKAQSLLPSQLLATVSLNEWRQALALPSLVAKGSKLARQHTATPLVLVGQRLYLRRYWRYEQTVASHLAKRLTLEPTLPAQLPLLLEQLFPEPLWLAGLRQTDWQKLACALAVRGNFCMITGGPGTGKTTTVVRLLALLQQSHLEQPLRIRLSAPTGKAAARLSESIAAQVANLAVSEAVRAVIPSEVTTLHRLLGSVPNSRHFRHHSRHLLPLDVLVVDEASMIDLEMMAALLSALPETARLILLGDKDQLASVEAGAVLGDLCSDATAGRYDPALSTWLENVSGESLAHPDLEAGNPQDNPLAQRTLMLRHSRRFGIHSGIGELAQAVNNQDSASATALLNKTPEDVHHIVLKAEQDKQLNKLLLKGWGTAQGYGHYLTCLTQTRPLLLQAKTASEQKTWQRWAAGVLTAFDDFRLLCALRKGPWGVAGLNERIAGLLHKRGLLESDQGWYEGRPVLVSQNDYSLGLMNGDIGIALRVPDETGRVSLRVAFAQHSDEQAVKFILPSRLTALETVFAMTVHKSQGSEFAHTALILPDSLNPVLTKELLYTGITRARKHFSLIESRAGIFTQALQKRVGRRSGLLEELTAQE